MASLLIIPLRILVFLVGFIAYWMEVAADWFVGARGRTEYVRTGKCRRCGRCCRCLSLIMPRGVSSRDRLVRFFRWWHGVAMNFRFIAEEESWLIYRCGYYRDGPDGKAGGCSIYPFRHRLCRFFPRQDLYGHPALHPDCGFRFVRRDAAMRRKEQRRHGRPAFDDLLVKGQQQTPDAPRCGAGDARP